MMDNDNNVLTKPEQEEAYNTIRRYVIDAQQHVYTAVNSAIVEIAPHCGAN